MKTVFIDMDGVLVNWLDQAIKTCGLELTKDIKNHFIQGGQIEDLVSNSWELIDKQGPEWWANLEPLPWYKNIINIVKDIGADFCILSSPGNILTHPQTAKNACQGKIDWLNKYLSGIDSLFGHKKYLCADKNKFLIDDNIIKCNKFIWNNGDGYIWPNQYLINNNNITHYLTELEYKLIDFRN